VDLVQQIILAILQGLTEFLPISSAAHLILVPLLTGWPDQGLSFDLAVHLGSLAAVVLYFRRPIGSVAIATTRSLISREGGVEARLGWAVLFATIPVGLAGLAFKGLVETTLRTPEVGALVIAAALIGFGLLLGWADWRHAGSRDEYDLTWKDVVVIGCAQALALIPGTSRSGITMTAALFMGFSREGAARFSFLLSIPVIVLAGGLQAVDAVRAPARIDWGVMAMATLVSALSAYLCIHYFLIFIQRIGMQPFVIYRVILGLILLGLFL